MEIKGPLLQGILLFPPQGMLGQLKKTWHKKYCQLFQASKYGIERLEIYDNQDEAVSQQHSPRIITLEACIKISPSNQPRVFTVVTKTGTYHFGCSSDTDMANWIGAIQSVAFKDNHSCQNIEEDNDLYCTSGEGVFSVKLVETDASKRCNLESKNYTLIVAAADIKLMDGDSVLYAWPYRYIRRYGYRDGKFTFEAGRKCESGEGSFRLEHSNQQEIFRCISSKMKSMKKLLGTEGSPSIECNDAQFHAALSMEAGSRSPLPPSPNSSASLIDIDFTTISQNSQKHLNSSSSSLESISFIKPPPPIIKPKPAKPPRKHIFAALLEKKSLDPEFLDLPACGKYRKLTQHESPELLPKNPGNAKEEDEKHSYDLVEVRSDAWKTHGIDSVPHTERPNRYLLDNKSVDKEAADDESQYELMIPAPQNLAKHKSSVMETVTPTSPIIHNDIASKTDSPNYDKLQHFGSTHKLNHNSGYKMPNLQSLSQTSQYSSSAAPTNLESNPSWNDYDIIDDMCAVRLADDSHLGYGIIRKKSNSSTPDTSNVGPKHKVYNESEYAIVSKPKRV
ncbi:docking protein 3 [Orussus abietinus]|uniref:docking protein 3 n=1 Tax=Orussus abietinus TaxID=222816 RepID=UPI000626830B|nr:docking protein 3 [Orussus abietinus]